MAPRVLSFWCLPLTFCLPVSDLSLFVTTGKMVLTSDFAGLVFRRSTTELVEIWTQKAIQSNGSDGFSRTWVQRTSRLGGLSAGRKADFRPTESPAGLSAAGPAGHQYTSRLPGLGWPAENPPSTRSGFIR